MSDETCWTLIEAAGAGDAGAREDFAARYLPAVRAYLSARWGQTPLSGHVEDALQEVFVECLKDGGALERAERDSSAGFRAYLYGVARNVAQRVEERRAREADRAEDASFHPERRPSDDPSLSAAFDRAFAIGMLRAALRSHRASARDGGERAVARYELLRQRFGEGKSIAEIAREQQADAAFLHHEYAVARNEFHGHLRQVVATHHPGAAPGEIERECEHLVDLVDD